MGKFYFVDGCYAPNTASGNRLWAMLKVLSEMKTDTEVIYFMSDSQQSEAPRLKHIHFNYYWKKLYIKSPKLQILAYIYLYSRMFLRKLKPGDIVYTYGCNELLSHLVKIKGIKVYHERTEHPEVSKLKLLNMPKYLDACTKVDKLFVISRNLKTYFSSIGVPSDKIEIINMTVDQSRFEGLQRNPKERYIAYCGKATNNKDGVNILIKSFSHISQVHPDVKLYIIGTSPNENDESGNMQLVGDLNLVDKVVFTGMVSHQDMPQMLKNAEVLVLARPSSKQADYGFPTKLGEYLLTENPVVITDVGNISDFLHDGKSAMIARPNDEKEFAAKVNWLLEHHNEAEIIGRNGAEVARKQFDSRTESMKMIRSMFDLQSQNENAIKE